MGTKIKMLPKEVINKIAAGEVIQRPASVVKELVENSIDAQASKLEIKAENGGKDLIQVIDNGQGMKREEAQLALKRHATSKISRANDLFSIRSLGFRGEALASIAAISKLEIRTRSEEELAGTLLKVSAGELLEVKDIGTPVGTNIIVKDLFYNTPVRYKYLKTTATEISKISDIINRLALAYPEISFKLIHNQRELLESPGNDSLLDTMFSIYGKEVSRELISVDYEDRYMQLRGYITKPKITRASAKHQSFFINRRYIKSKLLKEAVTEAYRSLIPKDRYPIVALMLKLNPILVDVNVHPQKMEVNFSRKDEIFKVVKSGIEEALAQADLSKKINLVEEKEVLQQDNTDEKAQQQSLKLLKESTDANKQSSKETKQIVEKSSKKEYQASKTKAEAKKGVNLQEVSLDYQPAGEVEQQPSLSEFLPLGQLNNTYLVAQGPQGLYIIDQHAAHERIIYNQLLEKAAQTAVQSQSLLVPIKLELTRPEIEILTEQQLALKNLGFEVEHFGGQRYLIRAVPQLLGKLKTKEICRDIIEELLEQGKINKTEKVLKNLATVISCKSAIKSGQRLLKEEMENLLVQLEAAKDKYSCPHGRPTIIHFSAKELAKKFKRI
ncbi:DNA mismatch repair endonuclease MutL [Fuchsiella alkaliacetigena]|uniref:DNA mismatch repair endonuclease MutL n=1 Tax=Fuchsiella alkaliacetigena TaxID=957042 RepID=UPI00200A8778|nr:DNA mismatch repair endonuclease MutL [Fuchsiella alkaliacetigena]MCK8825027.1 DNA mismatch repair endonuclease MutL [Fuchsiella alkaliacetigena]